MKILAHLKKIIFTRFFYFALIALSVLFFILILQWIIFKKFGQSDENHPKLVDLFISVDKDRDTHHDVILKPTKNDVVLPINYGLLKNSTFKLIGSFRLFCGLPIKEEEIKTTPHKILGITVVFATNYKNVTSELTPKEEIKWSRLSLQEKTFLNLQCLQKPLLGLLHKDFDRFFSRLNSKLKVDHFSYEQHSSLCKRIGLLNAHALMHAYSLGFSFAQQYGKNSNLKLDFLQMVYSQNWRSYLFGLAVLESFQQSLFQLNDSTPSLGIQSLVTEALHEQHAFCDATFDSCQCPYLRSLYGSFARYHGALMKSAKDDLLHVYEDLFVKRLVSMNRRRNNSTFMISGLLKILQEYDATDVHWLPSVHQLVTMHLCHAMLPKNAQDSSARSIFLENNYLEQWICKDTMQENPLDRSAKDLQDEFEHLTSDCIPQEVIHWLWKSEATIDSMYQSLVYFKAYTKMLMYPLIKRLFKDLQKASSQSLRVQFISILEEGLFYMIFALDLAESSLKAPLLARPQVDRSSRIVLELVEFAAHKPPMVFLSLNGVQADLKGKLCPVETAKPTKEASLSKGCKLNEIIKFIDSPTGYWANLGFEKFFAKNRTQPEFYKEICQRF